MDFVICKITASPARRQDFQRASEKKKVKVPTLIAGYGIRWNIKYQSRKRVYDAREVSFLISLTKLFIHESLQVINELLKDNYEKHQSQIIKARRQGSNKTFGEYKEIQFDQNDWNSIKELNDELEVRDYSKKINQ